MLKTYLPILVFAVLGLTVGGAFVMLNHLIGPKKPAERPPRAGARASRMSPASRSSRSKGFSFGVSFYLIAMLFILFDIEVVFLYPVGVILKSADSVFVLGELITFVVLLLVAFVYVWRKGALDWK